MTLSLSRYLTDTYDFRPEQLILQDDPSFLPEFAHPPPELLADLDPNFKLGATHSGDSQPLTPFGSQQSASASHVGSLAGLILPTSSPAVQGGFRLEGDYATSIAGQTSDMVGAGDTIEIEDPDFMFGDDGEIIQLSPGVASLRNARATVSDGAGRSTQLKSQLGEEQGTCEQVSPRRLFTIFFDRICSHGFYLDCCHGFIPHSPCPMMGSLYERG